LPVNLLKALAQAPGALLPFARTRWRQVRLALGAGRAKLVVQVIVVLVMAIDAIVAIRDNWGAAAVAGVLAVVAAAL
jgi:hypothetical protein